MQKYGQHFLVNSGIIEKIIDAVLPLTKNASLIEIGPGRGALTLKLIERGLTNFNVVEIDPQMVKHLQATPEIQNAGVVITENNFMDFDPASLGAGPFVFLSNLPYIDAADILDKVLNLENSAGAVFMFQREQAQRVSAKKGSDFYGPLSLTSQARANIKSLTRVSRGSFNPPPKVESEVLIFTATAPHKLNKDEYKYFETTVKAAFAYKRKNILNSLSEYLKKDKEEIKKAVLSCNINPLARAQELTETDYISLAKNLSKMVN
ncbi:16S rRNA (adenine1518-N6/adenine1519-N6)-dimethyltransferase [Elusimicrobium posterum]|uniref:16S rRNA (adenine(1518)-N(6)/adenine(1519)-N(6))- dimethyltransferase RsmA n=1 Tax=Elusimicrobium posterum TaxID=3116653 RepID=UPI003C74A530